uniref:EF-hand domain-containing protein n=1 Tax=Timema poppense TaxID=170557 RepID=A0A7R9D1Z9_TIMPO|nr:unnamed protein product [Timema poppensis]
MSSYQVNHVNSQTTSVPAVPLYPHWKLVFNKYDVDSDGKISLSELQHMIRSESFSHDIPTHVVKQIMEKADRDQNGYLTYEEFEQMVHSEENQGLFSKSLNRYVKSVVPNKRRFTRGGDTQDGSGLYEEQYSCLPPRLLMITISILEIASFLWDVVDDNTVLADGPAAKILMYNPFKRYEAWRFVTYMFVHVGTASYYPLSRGATKTSVDINFDQHMKVTVQQEHFLANKKNKSWLIQDLSCMHRLSILSSQTLFWYSRTISRTAWTLRLQLALSTGSPEICQALLSRFFSWTCLRIESGKEACGALLGRCLDVEASSNPLIAENFEIRSVFHLAVNLIVQIMLGIPLEMVHGWWRVVLVYLSGVVAGSLGTSISDPRVFLAGASGGVYALITAHVASIIMNWSEMEFPLGQLLIFVLLAAVDIGTAIYSRYISKVEDQIGYAAHIAGALAGLLVGINILRNLEIKAWERKVWWASMVLFSGGNVGKAAKDD